MQWLLCLFAVEALVRKVDKADKAYKYGPQHCVSLSRSTGGTCVIDTDCAATDIQNFTFDFICIDGVGTKVQHSFGEGNFDEQENFDTGVACAECKPTTGGVLVATGSEKEEGKEEVKEEAPAAKEEANVPPSTAAFYGPEGCVATYRSANGTCVMQTRCTGKDTSEYNFGLTCVDSEGSTTRHLFGANSFDPEETFDTLVECKLCLGLDGDDSTSVASLSKDVKDLQGDMKEIQANVKTIMEELKLESTKKEEKKEEESEDAPAAEDAPADDAPADDAPADDAPADDAPADDAPADDAPADDAPADDAPADTGFLHKAKRHHKKKAHHHHKARQAYVRRHKHSKPKRHVEVDDDESLDAELSDADLGLE
jgi:hypothetical protein